MTAGEFDLVDEGEDARFRGVDRACIDFPSGVDLEEATYLERRVQGDGLNFWRAGLIITWR